MNAIAPTTSAALNSTSRHALEQIEGSTLFRDYRSAFEETTGLPLAIRPVGSFRSPLHASSHANEFCAVMAASNPACAACLRLQQRLENEATLEPQTVECMAGLAESAAPIRHGESVLGHLQTGQVLLHRPTKPRFAAITRRLTELGAKVDLERLEVAYFRTRVLTRRHYESAVRLLGVFAQHLAAVSNQLIVQETHAESPVITRARAYMVANLAEELTLTKVARAMNTSAFYFCKIFKKATGHTFTEHLARLRVEQVKQLLLNPHTRISEAAFAAGFQSLSQFNRVFRQIEGEPPSGYRERIHGATTPARNAPSFSLAHAA